MDNIELYPFQRKSIELSLESFTNKDVRDLINIPTGGGKTRIPAVTAYMLLKNDPYLNFLFVAHRGFLLDQAIEEFLGIMPDMDYGIFTADKKECSHQFTFAMNASLHDNNLEAYFLSDGQDVVFIDECHHGHSAAITYTRIMEYFNTSKYYGYTATPYSNNGSLSKNWNLLYKISINELMRQGYLCPVASMRVKTNIDLSEVRKSSSSADGFNKTDMNKMINIEKRNAMVVDAYKKLLMDDGKELSCIIFALNKEHAKNLAKEFNRQGLKTECVTEETKPEERRAIIKRLESGETKRIVNCMIYTEGFNYKALESIIIARPIGSIALLLQILGRVMRNSESTGKKLGKIVLIDDKPGKHKILGLRDIIDGLPDTDVDLEKEEKVKELLEEYENNYLNLIEDAKIRSIEVENLFDGEEYIWVRDYKTGILTLDIDKNRRCVIEPSGDDFDGYFIEKLGHDTKEWLQARCASYIATSLPIDMALLTKIDEGNSTPAQRKRLANIFKRTPEELKFLTKAEASALMGLMFNKGKFDHSGRKKALDKFDSLKRQKIEQLNLK